MDGFNIQYKNEEGMKREKKEENTPQIYLITNHLHLIYFVDKKEAVLVPYTARFCTFLIKV